MRVVVVSAPASRSDNSGGVVTWTSARPSSPAPPHWRGQGQTPPPGRSLLWCHWKCRRGPSCRNSHPRTSCSAYSRHLWNVHSPIEKTSLFVTLHPPLTWGRMLTSECCVGPVPRRYWLFGDSGVRRVLADPYWPGWCPLPILPSHCTRPKVREKLSSEVVQSTVQPVQCQCPMMYKKVSGAWVYGGIKRKLNAT